MRGCEEQKEVSGTIIRQNSQPSIQAMVPDTILFRFARRETARLSFTARIGRAQFYRARSASKKDGLAVPLLFF